MTDRGMKEILDDLYERYNTPVFIENDPISIPHGFAKKEDIEVAGFLVATIAWGNRNMIIRNGRRMVELMEGEPHRFITEASEGDLAAVAGFVHRTFNNDDFLFFLKGLGEIYRSCGGIEGVFTEGYLKGGVPQAIDHFRSIFLAESCPKRVERHVPSVERNSACKRINMFLRWMVRDDGRGVDFGLWKGIPASALHIPLDVHAGNTARHLGLLERRSNDWRAVEELTNNLCRFDAADPVKYDFALFGAGVNKGL